MIVYAAIARRAGVRLHPVGGGRFVILADPSSTPAVAFDPIGVPRRVPRTIGWVCPHVFGTMILEALSGRLVERGEIDIAARALQLTFAFPLRGGQRARSMRGLASLRARLN